MASSMRNDSLDGPPSYESLFSTPSSTDLPPYPDAALPEISATTDGRVNVQVGSRFSRSLEWMMRQATPEESHRRPSPARPHRRDTVDIRLNVVIQIVGSRGDVQPFVALGQALQAHGHRVRLATHATFASFVAAAGLEFYPIGGDPSELMSYMVRNPGLIPSMKSLRAGDIQRKRAAIAEILLGCWQSCIDRDPQTGRPFVADAIIANPPSFAHVHCAQALGIPVHVMFTMPWTSTRAFPHPLANVKYSGTDPSLGSLLSYHFVEWITWQGMGDLVNKWRRDTLELEPIPLTEGPNLSATLNVPFTYCWSPALIPKPSDWGSHIDVCGFLFREVPAYEPAPELEAFLRAGEAPIYIGFGSIVVEDPQKMLATLLDAIKKAGVRAVISSGWSGLAGPELPHVHYLRDCPHEWLFPHVAAVVHHGGAGTTACGLLHGKPTTVVPFFGDQAFWGNMVAAAGAGPKPIPCKQLTAESLAEAITFCLSPSAVIAAKNLSRDISRESGVQAAVASFHAHLPQQQMNCDLIPGQAAVWRFKKGKQVVRLSRLAAGCLTEKERLQGKHLKRHQTKRIVIDTRRWDPVTAISSSSLSTVGAMADASVGIFLDPYLEYQRHQSTRRCTSPGSSSANEISSVQASLDRQRAEHARQMAWSCVSSLGKFLGRTSRGFLIDLPLAAADGMLAVPRLYGEAARQHGPVTNWASGITVGLSTFTRGVYEGATDIFVYTFEEKKRQGALGVAKGLTKGLVSMTMKTGGGSVGLVAYPSQGVYRSLRAAVKNGLAKKIEQAVWEETKYEMRAEDGMRVEKEAVYEMFDELMCSREK